MPPTPAGALIHHLCERKWTVEQQTIIPAESVEPAWLDEPCPGGLPWMSCTADECECSRQPVLVLTCMACQQVREHPVGERVSFECADPDCGGWVLTARLIGPNPNAAAEPDAARAAQRRVREFLAARAENRSGDLIATKHYHDGMGHAVAVLRADDLRALAATVGR